jgi:tetratricopeptide (TPR) repeat protein
MAVTSEIEKLERRWQENPLGLTFAPYAEACRKAGELAKALELLETGLAQHPTYVPAHIVRGRCHLDAHADGPAEQAFLRVTELDPENVIALRGLAEIAERSGRLAEAVQRLKQLLDVDRGNDDARGQLDRVLELQSAPVPPPPPAPPAPPAPLPAAEPVAMPSPESWTAGSTPEMMAAEAPGDEEFNEPSLLDLSALDLKGPAPAAAQLQEFEVPNDAESLRSAQESPHELEYQDESAGDQSHAFSGVQDVELPELTDAPLDAAASEEPWAYPEPPGDRVWVSEPDVVEAGPPIVDVVPPPPPAVAEDETFLPPPPLPPLAVLEEAFLPPPPEPAEEEIAVAPPLPPVPEPLQARAEPEPVREPAAEPVEPELVVTTSMAEVFLRQGYRELARAVYIQLAERDPSDARVAAALAELRPEPASPPADPLPPPAPAPEFGAASTGGRSVEQLFSSLLSTGRPAVARTVHPPAFEAARPPAGEPTRPAQESLSLSSVFGEAPAPAPATGGPAVSGEGEPSFDEFYSGPVEASAEQDLPKAPPIGSAAPPAAPEDLEQFNAWLRGLKR